MYDEFIEVARHEIQMELIALGDIITYCSNDEQIFQTSKDVVKHIHKIKGLAPMMGQDDVGKIAKISETVLKYIIEHGSLIGSYKFIVESIESMKNLFSGKQNIFVDDFIKRSQATFTQISSW
ncbi:MAG TPA: hypothetical protein VEJ68_04995 [Candidatus Bathyarchaeia archaeon]|nr:hypothetical protein [Candidatus Bathyarchaeia archaeon]